MGVKAIGVVHNTSRTKSRRILNLIDVFSAFFSDQAIQNLYKLKMAALAAILLDYGEHN